MRLNYLLILKHYMKYALLQNILDVLLCSLENFLITFIVRYSVESCDFGPNWILDLNCTNVVCVLYVYQSSKYSMFMDGFKCTRAFQSLEYNIKILISIFNWSLLGIYLFTLYMKNLNFSSLLYIQTDTSGKHMSRLMEKPTICIGENKHADQLRGNHEADQRLCFRYSDSTVPLLLKSEISSFYLFSVTVQVGLCRTWSETTLLVFPRGGSYM